MLGSERGAVRKDRPYRDPPEALPSTGLRYLNGQPIVRWYRSGCLNVSANE